MRRNRNRNRVGLVRSQGAPVASDVQRILFTLSVAEINAAGAVTTASFAFPSELPAGSQILTFRTRNKGDVINSSGGTITFFSVTLTFNTTNELISPNPSGMNLANQRGQGVANGNAVQASVFPMEGAWTPRVRIAVAGAGVTLGNLIDGAAGIECELIYREP